MASDMMVAFGPATAHGQALFGLNHHGGGHEQSVLRCWRGGSHPPDESIQTSQLALAQVRQTNAVFGLQRQGEWGLLHGCNQHQVALGVASWRSRLPALPTGLTGTELVRLTLERSHSARHAIDVLTDLIARHGHGGGGAAAFMLADPQEAYLLEAVGACWALLECQSARAVADIGLIRQDWQRLAPGLAELAIEQGWWSDDGVKLDFMGSLGKPDPADSWALKRWGKATLALAQHSGTLDALVLRRLLAEHFEANVRPHPLAPPNTRRQASLIACLQIASPALIWVEAGSATAPIWFPLVPDAQVPEAWFTNPPGRMSASRIEAIVTPSVAERLQGIIDQDAEEFVVEAPALLEAGERTALRRLAEAMMHKHLEQWTAACRRHPAVAPPHPTRVQDEELAPFAFG